MAHKHYYLDDSSAAAVSISPRLKYTGSVSDDPTWFNIEHSHNFCEVLYVLSGCGMVRIQGQDYPIHAGNLIIYNPFLTHQERSDENDQLHFLFFAADSFQLENLPPSCLIPEDMFPIIDAERYRKKLDLYFTDLINESASGIAYCKNISQSLLNVLIIMILRITMTTSSGHVQLSSTCKRIKNYIDQNYISPITLESLSNSLYISKDHLSHLFKTETGVSPIRYVIQRRCEEACRLLLETSLSVKEIAMQVGYDDPVYFSQIFKKVTGSSPNIYRKQHSK